MQSSIFAQKEPEKTGGKDLDYVGFANLPNQIYRRATRQGFEFTIMVVGESGLGKSTFLNTLFLTDIYSNEYPGPTLRTKKTLEVETTRVLLSENGVKLTLTVVDTPGFGDAVDNSECWKPILEYINQRYEDYLEAESNVQRSYISDRRVHCCLYFISPSVYGLKLLDIEFLKQLHDKVNIIPLIAKADTMTLEECELCKRTILGQLAKHKIKIYDFPSCDNDDDNKTHKIIKQKVPFAIIGSNALINATGKQIRGRKYPWGIAEVDNSDHCDSLTVRNLLLRTHMHDLMEVTGNVHYENFRSKKLAGASDGKSVRISNKNPLAQMEEEKRNHDENLKHKVKEMENVFEFKVKEKLQKLKDSEAELQRHIEQLNANLEKEHKELEEKRRAFEKEKSLEELTQTTTTNQEKKREKKKSLF
ncbi:septin-7-like isoform X2 [Centruroides sculpturatus]|uniref:septin-7-like isoform X2 n=1 Tax=Centruroides sculpturatus TaxID=218467 RepID=UPI000C6D7D72|nr:septin-7-like isoform X2 [Centruroides sculpturatus]